jgi:hypothetical protein
MSKTAASDTINQVLLCRILTGKEKGLRCSANGRARGSERGHSMSILVCPNAMRATDDG